MHPETMEDMLGEPIDHARIKPGMGVDSLVRQMDGCALGAGRLAEAVDIYYEMLSTDATKFFGLAGPMVPAGMRNIVSDLIRDGYIDVLVTTGSNVVHDLLESLGLHHYRAVDNFDDMDLKNHEINRICDVLIPEQHFVDLEENVQYILGDIGGESISISELMFLVGNYLDDDGSILRAAADMDVPVFCPGIQDSMIGLQAWLYKQTNPFNVDAFADMKELIEICNDAVDPCAMFVGGGVAMNYILQSMLVTPNEFDHVVHLSMDMHSYVPGFSCLDEARSWGKIGEDASYVTLYSDASITLPIIVAAVRTRLENGYI